MRYGELRWPDIQQMDKQRAVVVCPLASLEQHGHHLPLLTDTLLVTGVAERVHQRLSEQVLLTPTLWLGASDHHLDFPGTVSVRNTIYVELIKDVARSFVRAGFRRILFLNGHGGNIAPGEVALTEMANSSDACDAAHLALGSYWTLASAEMDAARHGMSTPALSHACEYETSMMLFLHEELVAMESARGGGPQVVEDHRGVAVAGRFHRRTRTGALGQPEASTKEKGETLIQAIVDRVSDFLGDFAEWPFRDVLPESFGQDSRAAHPGE
ncbi:MAG: creatininase family protein [Pirellulales bacterium]